MWAHIAEPGAAIGELEAGAPALQRFEVPAWSAAGRV
jgi:hypothetical protein